MHYIRNLMEKSTPDKPTWNIERIREGKNPEWNYIDGCMIKAVLEMYSISGDPAYLKFADDFIDYYVFDDGTIRGFSVEEYNIDSINEGKVLFDLYRLTGKEKYRKAIDLIYSQVKTQPRTKAGNFWHKKIYPDQIWLDGLYMAQPFYTEYETLYNDCAGYDDIYSQIRNVDILMRDQVTGLSYHAYDESKEMFWCDKATGLSPNFWLRAMGWYVMALVDVLEKMVPERAGEKFTEIRGIFVRTIDALLRYQDESGMWYQVIDRREEKGNYLETSGSAIISYAILKGVRLGFLPETYRIYGERAFDGIRATYLKEKDGELNLGGICLVAGLGGKQMRDGSLAYYFSEPVVENEAKGVAPFLLVYTEIIRFRNSD